MVTLTEPALIGNPEARGWSEMNTRSVNAETPNSRALCAPISRFSLLFSMYPRRTRPVVLTL